MPGASQLSLAASLSSASGLQNRSRNPTPHKIEYKDYPGSSNLETPGGVK